MSSTQAMVVIAFVVATAICVLAYILPRAGDPGELIEANKVVRCVEASDGSPMSVWMCGGEPTGINMPRPR